MIPESFIQELLARIDIVDVIERYLPLKKAGANYQACCPFHSEKTPSFSVSPSKQFYHCFGCSAHGSAIGFVMQYAGLGFIDAVEELAHSAGMQVPRVVALNQQEQKKKAPLTELMARAMTFYRDQLKASGKAIDYLKARGLTGEIAARFGLGYAPDEWQGLERVFPDYKDPALVECGLLIESQPKVASAQANLPEGEVKAQSAGRSQNSGGRRYDRFRDRVMFPILDQRGNVIGFGGRVIGDGEPKYLNSPETPLFEKGRELYGLPQARQAIRDSDTVIVVEGYMDVVALAQHGIGNAVATLGTATTPNHLHKLLRQAAKVVFCFDGDRAGRKAAWRALEASLEQLADDKMVGFLFLPPEHDPDSFVRAEGAEKFRQLAAHPTTLTEFLLRELASHVDLATAEGRAHLVHEAKPMLQRLAAPILRVQLTKALAEAAALTQAEVEAECGIKPLTRGRPPPPRQRGRAAPRQLDHQLLELVIRRPERAARLPLPQMAADTPEGLALHAIAAAFAHGELPAGGVGLLLEHFRGSQHEAVIGAQAAALAEDADEGALEAVFNDTLDRLRQSGLAQEIAALSARARVAALSPGERDRLKELLTRKAQGAGGKPAAAGQPAEPSKGG